MNDHPANPTIDPSAAPAQLKQKQAAGQAELFPISRSWKIGLGGAVVMTLLALVGVGLTQTSRELAPVYWISLVPVYGAACVGIAWARASHEGTSPWAGVTRQVLHWVGIAI